MYITNSERIADDLNWEIRESVDYSANPLNDYHSVYQSMINRVMGVFLFLMYVTACIMNFGLPQGLLISLGSVAAAVFGLFGFSLLVLAILEMVADFSDWIRGY